MPDHFKIGWAAVVVATTMIAASSSSAPPSPHWIWSSDDPGDGEKAVFATTIEVPEGATRLSIRATADNRLVVRLDGEVVLRHADWSVPGWYELDQPAAGKRRLEFDCLNESGPAGLAAVITVEHADGDLTRVSDVDWEIVGAEKSRRPFDFGTAVAATGIWKNPFAEGLATPVEDIRVPDGFEVELLHAARPGEGSWSAMTVDDRGRVVISPQYGPLLRITPSEIKGGSALVERLHEDIGRAQGLLVVGDDIYANVADDPKRTGGLWRFRDSDGDDRYETVERLGAYGSGSEHGPHGMVLGPDGMIWMVNGNYASLPSPLRTPSPHDGWAEDTVIERIWDPRGHAVGIRSPGGVLLRTDLEASEWEIMAAGMRNPYDLDFNADGEFFTYDADMEWDIGLPWYRTPRFVHLVSGAEFGWRSGSGKWPLDSAEAFPAVLEMDAGSPTGVASGHRSDFPEPWRSSMFLGDWAYGRVLAVEMTPDGATYRGEPRPFLQGRPFNVTDFAFAPDGSMVLSTGGRGSQSGLYRVRWTGAAASAAVSSPDADRNRRQAVEISHRDPDAVELEDLLAAMGDRDSAVRRAARVGFEHRLRAANRGDLAVDDSRDAAAIMLEEGRMLPAADGGWEIMLATMRAGDRAQAIGSLERILDAASEDDSAHGRRALARALALLWTRHGPLDPADRETVLALLDEVYPTGRFDADRILVEVLVALEAPFVVQRTMPLVTAASSPQEAIHHLHALRLQSEGWDEDSIDAAVDALDRLATETGGASFPGYVNAIREAIAPHLGPMASQRLANLAEARGKESRDVEARRFVRAWDVEAFEPHLSRVNAGRDFARGESLFTALQCGACHQVGGVGIAYGPDLTGVGARFSPRDLLIASIDPARDLSDQYAGVLVRTRKDELVLGLPIERTASSLAIAPDPRAGVLRTEVALEDIVSEEPASPMPAGLMDTASMDEVLDLLAYLRSAGNPDDPAFQRPP
ncbi:MAG: hypothetical protein CMJ23_11860 [Phycisphaerae bacterium]|nr:hypothetical protein [Phycisphaerae bacterium]